MDGEKCLIKNWKFVYSASYQARSDQGAYEVIELTPRVVSQEDTVLRLESVNGQQSEIKKEDLKQIQFHFSPPSGEMSMDVQKAVITLQSKEVLEVEKRGQNPMEPDQSYEWNLQELKAQTLSLKGEIVLDDCYGHALDEISLSKPFIHPKYQPLRIEFLN